MRDQIYTMSHIGVNVPDIAAAVTWYRDVLGCFVLAEPSEVKDDGTHFGNVVKNIFGAKFQSVKLAHVTTACGVGIELFEFVVPKTHTPDNTFDYSRAGIFHFCLTTADVNAAAARVEKNGGKILSRAWKLFNKESCSVIYCQDPWGTVIEFYDAPYDQYFSNMGGVTNPMD